MDWRRAALPLVGNILRQKVGETNALLLLG
jgi:hypothetical protein